ncbi:MAG: YdeI/OmpD-associated family protein [Flavobacteriales bacterium]|nr:YdeI/OmpD-associated family protein [Flavobacteriales bacterium]
MTQLKNPSVDFFFAKETPWKEAFEQLRSLVLDCGLSEELKWGVPCYTFQNSNVVLMHGFKKYCALLFHKGALLKDSDGILIQQTENVQSARQIRFTNIKDVIDQKATLRAYVYEAIEVEKAGLKVPLKKTSEFSMPDEFQLKLDALPSLKAAFEGLTPGRQRAYILHFSAPKQSKTREARIEKYIPHILSGKGFHDR